jgi:fibronectin-binding autotransporter adhesin
MAFKSWWKLLSQSENRNSSIRRKKHFAAAVRLEVLEDRFAPATLTWQGGAGNFSDATKWSPSAVPADGDTLIFDGTGGAATATNDLAAGLSFVLNFSSSGNVVSGSAINLDVAGTDISDTVGGNTITAGLNYVNGTEVSVGAGTLSVGNGDGSGGQLVGTGATPSLTKTGAGTFYVNAVATGTNATLNANAGTLGLANVGNTFNAGSNLNVPTGGAATIATSPSSSFGAGTVNLSGGTVNLITGVGGAAATPGMYEGRLAGGNNWTDPLPINYFIEFEPKAGVASDNANSPWTPDGNPNGNPNSANTLTWTNQDNLTFMYLGQVFISDGSDGILGNGLGAISFAENIDDNVFMRFDGQTIINDGAWNTPTRATLTPTVGWHDFDVRFGEFGGGAGAVGGNGWTPSFGFGYNQPFEADGVTARATWSPTGADGSNFVPFNDSTGTFIRLPQASGTSANPFNVTANSTINLSATLPATSTNTSTLSIANGVNLAVNGAGKTLAFTGAGTLGGTTTFSGTGGLTVSGAISTPAAASITQTGSGTTTLSGKISATTLTATANAGTLAITSLANAFDNSSTVNANTGGTVQISATPGTSIGAASVNITGGNLSLTTGVGGTQLTAPGMFEGWLDGGFNTTSPNPNTWVVNQPEAGYKTNNQAWADNSLPANQFPNPRQASPVVDRRWHDDNYLSPGAANETWIYNGQFFLSDASDGIIGNNQGTIGFIEQIDDNVLMKIDGRVALSDTSWNTPTSVAFTGAVGWHDFEIRFANGGGGAGANSWSDAEGPFGFGYNQPNLPGWSAFSTDQAAYPLHFRDDGSGSFIRRVTGFAATSPFNNPISISGNSGVSVDSTINATTNVDGPLSIAGGSKITFTQANTNGRAAFTNTTTLGGNVEFNMTSGAGLARPRFNGPVVGAASILKSGPGNVTLAGANTYSGSTTITGGTFFAANANALAGTSSITVTAGTLQFAASGINVNVPVTVQGSGNGGAGAIQNASGNNSISTNINVTGDVEIQSDAGTLTLSGGLSLGTNSLTYDGAGNINVTGAISALPSTDVSYVGFTGATGGLNVTQTIQSWTLTSGATNVNLSTPLTLNGSATQAGAGAPLVLTPAINSQTGSAWTKVSLGSSFTSTFDFTFTDITNPADMFYFAIQSNSLTTLGGGGGGGGLDGVPNSIGAGFNIYNGNTLNNGNDFVVNQNGSRTNFADLSTLGVDFRSSNTYRATVAYASGTVTVSLLNVTTNTNYGTIATIPGVAIPTTKSGGLFKNGTGTVTQSGANTYTGKTTINNGILAVNSTGLGNTTSVTVNNGGTLGLDNTTIGAGIPITASGNGFNNSGAIASVGGTSTITNQVVGAGVSFGATAGNTLVLTGGVKTLGGDVGFGGAGTVNVNGPMDLVGGSAFQTGTVTGYYFQSTPSNAALLVNTDPTYLGSNLGTALVTSPFTSNLTFPNISGAGFVTDTGVVYADSTVGGLTGPNYDNVQGFWKGKVNVPNNGAPGNPISFQTGSDDGSVIYVDGQLVVNNNFDQGVTYRQGTINLTPGLHDIEIAFRQGGGGAGMFALWDPTGGSSFRPLGFTGQTGKVTQFGTGTTNLNGSANYSSLSITAGTFAVSTQAGVSGSSINVASGGSYALSGTGITVATPISIAGQGAGNTGAINNISGNNTLTGAITLNGDGSIGSAAGTLSVNGNITAAGSFFSPIPSGNLTFTGAGNITVNGQIQNAPLVTAANELAGKAYNNINPSNGGVPLTPTAAGWLGNYTGSNITSSAPLTVPIDFPNIDTAPGFTGWVNDPNLAFNVGALWYGLVTIPAGATATQTWYTASDDGSRLWIDGNLVVDNNFDQGVTQRQGTTNLAPGSTHAILIGFYQGGGGAGMFADWNVTGTQERIPVSAFTRVVSGGGVNAVIKNGTGTVSLAAAAGNSYPGGTTINAGTLAANNTSNSATGSGAVTVAGGTLGGTGTVTGPVAVNTGSVAPGNSAGTLKVTGDVNFTSTSTFNVELDSPAAADKLEATGTVNLGNAQLSVTALPAAVVSGTVYTIASGSSVSGTFNGLANGASFTQSGVSYTINYTATTVTLTVNAPSITGLSPFSGPTAGGNTVIISGTNFGAGVTGAAAVKFGAVNATSYVVISSSQIQAVAPAQAAGTVNVSVTNNGQTSANTAADDYTYGSASPAPNFGSLVVNGGDMYAINAYGVQVSGLAGKNSVIEQLYVTFDIGVTVGAGAFTLDAGTVNQDIPVPGGTTPVPAGTNVVTIIAEPDATTLDANGGFKGYRLRFSGSSTYLNTFNNSPTGNGGAGNIFTTLKDGFYKLNIIGANVHAGSTTSGTSMASNVTQGVWTMFASYASDDISISANPGDGNSIISVNSSVIDFAKTNGYGYGTVLSDANGAYNANFDWNLDGDVGDDLIEFAKRFGAQWSF